MVLRSWKQKNSSEQINSADVFSENVNVYCYIYIAMNKYVLRSIEPRRQEAYGSRSNPCIQIVVKWF